MRKIIIFIAFLVFLFAVTQKNLNAQSFDFSRAFQDYIYNLSLYQKDYSAYQLAKGAYLDSQTPGSTANAISATTLMLTDRDNVVSTYLTALRMKLLETKGVSDAEKNGFYSLLDTDVSWWGGHKTRLTSAGSLDDLVKDSDEAKTHFANTQILSYQTLIEIGISENTNMRTLIQNEIGALNSKIAEIKSNGDKDTSAIERFMVDIQNKLSRSSDKETEARNLMNGIKPDSQNSTSTYQTAVGDIENSLSYLKEADTDLRNVITQIKTN